MHGRRETFLAEDYLVFSVNALGEPMTAEELLARRGEEIALLLTGERSALSRQEQGEILRNHLSYLADDLVIPTWNAAFVYDTEAGSQAALEIFEFANSQLLEFRVLRRSARYATGPDLHEAAASALVRRHYGARLHSCRQGSARAVHRRERDHRPD